MCNALEELVNEGFQKGFQEGFQLQKEKLLRGCIRAGKENDVDEETVIKVISEEFSMSEEEVTEVVKKYWKTKRLWILYESRGFLQIAKGKV